MEDNYTINNKNPSRFNFLEQLNHAVIEGTEDSPGYFYHEFQRVLQLITQIWM